MQMGDRVILHSDINCCYASIEHLHHPELAGKPLAVGGDPEARHGIVLTADYIAKKYGVKTGMALWQAKQVCPDITFVSPRMDLYLRFSRMAHEIYAEYTDRQEPYGIDECWLDVTGSSSLKGDGLLIAQEISRRMKSELGITVSVGVSFNKIFAKLGSDYKKPDAITTMYKSEFKQKAWSLPVADLLYVGKSTNRKLALFNVTYYAKVNDKAVVAEKNSAKLEYGNDPDNTTETTPSEAKTPTYPLNIKKTDHKTSGLLAGAKFSLYTETEYNKDADTRQAIKVTGINGNYVVDPTSENTVFESAATKIGENEYNLHVNGLAEGTYYLVETKAPDGFNKLTAPVVIKITKSADTDVNKWTISKDGTVENDKIIDIENSTGSLLPSTGGRGAIAFAVIAALLVFGVAVSFIRDKRKEA